MSLVNKKLAITAAAAALATVIGAAVAQDTANRPDDAMQQQQVEVNGPPADHQIYFFRDQGNAPESDPAAHLMLIKHDAPVPVPVAETTTTTTTVAQTTETAPAPVDNTATDNSATTTDTTAMPADDSDNQPPLAPKADRN